MHARSRMHHRVVVSDSPVAISETGDERVTSAAWAVFFTLLAICIVLMVLWTQVQMAVASPRKSARSEASFSDKTESRLPPAGEGIPFRVDHSRTVVGIQ